MDMLHNFFSMGRCIRAHCSRRALHFDSNLDMPDVPSPSHTFHMTKLIH